MIDHDGTQLGVKTLQEAMALSQERGMDLVEIAPTATPPVCKIADYSKLLYEQDKKARDSKKKQKGGHLKEIRMRPNIGEHDLMVKMNHAKEFLEKNDKVRFTIMFKGRENTHKDLGDVLAKRIRSILTDSGELEGRPFQMGNRLMMSFIPKKVQLQAKPAKKAENTAEKKAEEKANTPAVEKTETPKIQQKPQ